ncbi:cathelicidin-related antimicrobial peptide Na_CRAMP-like [Pyxicephalus adspersus]|uniref:cathelicidin-related antimicrobial peptide Na_CRAMP-like n=1 Tax=Pyxicephalus adspersus TaxID=30357 RepID=UPI003B5C8F1A
MRLFANLFFLLGAAAIAACMSSPLVKWSEDDITVMALYSRDYYNKVSGEDVIYGVLENDTEYTVDESSGFHQLSFPIQETICQKSDKEMADNCMFKEGGVVKFCTAKFHMEDDEDILMVTCQSQDSQQNVCGLELSSDWG